MAVHLDLVGRQGEVARIDQGLDAARAGLGGIVLVEGAAGIGKSRLLEVAAQRARAAGFRVLCGEGEELEQARPFGPLVEALGISARSDDERLADIGRHLGRHADLEASLTVASGRFVVQEAILDVVEALASETPLLLIVDDLQWADEPTAATLAALCRRVADLSLLIVAAFRPSPPPLARLVDLAVGAGAGRIALSALDGDAVEQLVTELVDAPPGPALLHMLEGAAGNPFFVIELVCALREADAIILQDGRAESRSPGVPPTLRQTILRRIRTLSPSTLELLRGAAVLGGSFDVDDLAALLDRSPVSLHGDAVAAVESGLLEELGPRLRIRHDLIREAVYHDLPEAIRVSIHRRAGAVLAERGASAVVVANHQLAAHTGGADAAQLLRRAASEVGGRDPKAALAMLDHALGLGDLPPGEEVEIEAERVPMLVALGRLGEAERAARAALSSRPSPETEARLRTGLAEVLLAAGAAADAVEELEAAGTAALDDEQRALLVADTAWARLDVFDLDGSARDAETAVRWGSAHHHPVVRSSGLAIQSRLAAFGADFARAVDLGEEAVRAAGDDPAAVRANPHLFLGLALVNADRPDDAVGILAEGRRRAEIAGIPWAVASYQNASILCGFHSDTWDDVIAVAEGARTLHLEAGTRAGYLQMESMLGLMWLHRAEYELARDALARAEADFAEPGTDAGGIVWLLWLRSSFAELDGDVEEATRLLGAAFDLAEQLRVHSVKLWYGPELVRLALASGDDRRAAEVARSVELAAGPASTGAASAATAACAGLVTRDPDLLLAAAACYRPTRRRLDLARVCEAAGSLLVERGRRDEAVAALGDALTACGELGAAHDARRLSAHLRALGVNPGVRGRRRRPTTGPDSLTPTERTVLELVGAGLPNREIADRLFVSRRTVETHVGRLYAKLGVRGRVALAREAATITGEVPEG